MRPENSFFHQLVVFTTIFALNLKGDFIDEESTFGCKAPEVSLPGESVPKHQINFTNIHEVQFLGIIGPLDEKRMCKIRCLNGLWIGPLCTVGRDSDQFQPMLRQCMLKDIDSEVKIMYNGKEVEKDGNLYFPHGSVLSASCRQIGKFKFNGNGTMTCFNGNWYNGNPSCTQTTFYSNMSVKSPPTILFSVPSGDIGQDDEGSEVVLPGSIVHLDCIYQRQKGNPEWSWSSTSRQYPTGWVLTEKDRNTKFRVSIYYARQSDSGTFTCLTPTGYSNVITIIVKDVKCPLIQNHNPIRTIQLQGNVLNSIATITCVEGYVLQGPGRIKCMANGKWSSSIPSCRVVSCPRILPDDPHVLMSTHHTKYKTRVSFSCPSGYRLIGSRTIRCLKDGAWSGDPPVCKMTKCEQPMPPAHGTVLESGRYMVDDYVQYTCLPGYKLVGQQITVCKENGKWSHSPPLCQKMCEFVGEPENGKINPVKFYYDIGEKIHVTCDSSYRPIGQVSLKCKQSGEWSAQMPTCA